jgi:hypothetical protein
MARLRSSRTHPEPSGKGGQRRKSRPPSHRTGDKNSSLKLALATAADRALHRISHSVVYAACTARLWP